MAAFDYIVVGGGTAGCVLAAHGARMIEGLRVARAIGTARALAPSRDKELFPGPSGRTDAAVLAMAERAASLLTGEQAVPS